MPRPRAGNRSRRNRGLPAEAARAASGALDAFDVGEQTIGNEITLTRADAEALDTSTQRAWVAGGPLLELVPGHTGAVGTEGPPEWHAWRGLTADPPAGWTVAVYNVPADLLDSLWDARTTHMRFRASVALDPLTVPGVGIREGAMEIARTDLLGSGTRTTDRGKMVELTSFIPALRNPPDNLAGAIGQVDYRLVLDTRGLSTPALASGDLYTARRIDSIAEEYATLERTLLSASATPASATGPDGQTPTVIASFPATPTWTGESGAVYRVEAIYNLPATGAGLLDNLNWRVAVRVVSGTVNGDDFRALRLRVTQGTPSQNVPLDYESRSGETATRLFWDFGMLSGFRVAVGTTLAIVVRRTLTNISFPDVYLDSLVPLLPAISAFAVVPTAEAAAVREARGPSPMSVLSWETVNATSWALSQKVGAAAATSVSIPQTAEGSVSVPTPTADTVWTLTATSGGGSATATANYNYTPARQERVWERNDFLYSTPGISITRDGTATLYHRDYPLGLLDRNWLSSATDPLRVELLSATGTVLATGEAAQADWMAKRIAFTGSLSGITGTLSSLNVPPGESAHLYISDFTSAVRQVRVSWQPVG